MIISSKSFQILDSIYQGLHYLISLKSRKNRKLITMKIRISKDDIIVISFNVIRKLGLKKGKSRLKNN